MECDIEICVHFHYMEKSYFFSKLKVKSKKKRQKKESYFVICLDMKS